MFRSFISNRSGLTRLSKVFQHANPSLPTIRTFFHATHADSVYEYDADREREMLNRMEIDEEADLAEDNEEVSGDIDLFEHVYLSHDDLEVARLAEDIGADPLPYYRVEYMKRKEKRYNRSKRVKANYSRAKVIGTLDYIFKVKRSGRPREFDNFLQQRGVDNYSHIHENLDEGNGWEER